MYCPGCGFQNPTGSKFCKQCGTNLAAVSDALSGSVKSTDTSEELGKLIRVHYAGRRKAILGATLIGGSMLVIIILGIFRFIPVHSFIWPLFGLSIWGIIELATGFSQWLSSQGELKARGYDLALGASAASRSLPSAELTVISASRDSASSPGYSTGPIGGAQVSVTEQTTRKLEEKAPPQIEH